MSSVWVDDIFQKEWQSKLSNSSRELLMIKREYALSRYYCNPSLTTDKIIVIVIYSSFLLNRGKDGQ